MKKNLKKFSTILLIALSLAILITGCSTDKKNDVGENVPGNEEGFDADQSNNLDGDRNINKGNVSNSDISDKDNMDLNADKTMMDRSKNIANKISELDKVNSANVLITGNTALIGIDIPKESNDEATKEIKNRVENKAKEADKDIDNVVVTADADLITRIKNLGSDIESGKPISGLGEEIEEIIKRITPNM